ncbi:MAG TPA: DUF6484 domain-containing protein [Polyangiales bacterium]|nr:DUF6484 domain-containing protein [Polyangiales bacterium]
MTKAIKRALKSKSPTPVTSLPRRGHQVGRIVGFREGRWLVECPAGAAPAAARTTVPNLSAKEMAAVASSRQEALIVYENEGSERPIVVGLLAPPPAAKPGPTAKVDKAVEPALRSADVDALVDGRRVAFDAREEIVLRCGQASITLRRNGRIVVRGTYVETRARGVNRIKGGSVQIN